MINNAQVKPRNISLLLFVLIAGIVQAQTAPNALDGQGRKQGPWERFYENGKPVYQVTFVDDQPTGTMTRYYEEGGTQAIVNYGKKGKAKAQLFYPDTFGLMAEGNYQNQLKDSVWLFYTPGGNLSSREGYIKGKKNGQAIVYYPDGSVSEKSIYLDDERHGMWEQFYQNGNPKLTANVVNGIGYEGEYVSYYPNGSKMLKGKYLEGKKTSSWYHFNENGSIEIIYVYRFGKVTEEHPKNGKFEGYYPDDLKEYEYTYKNGLKEGPFVEYYRLGEWVTEESLDEFGNKRPVQKLHGVQIKRQGKFKNDKLHGEVKTYSEKGKLTSAITYKEGVPVE